MPVLVESKSTFTKAAPNLIQVLALLFLLHSRLGKGFESIEDVDSIATTNTSIIEKNADQQHRKLWVVTF